MMFALCSSISVHAYDFEANGVYYSITDSKAMNVGVTSGTNAYAGDVIIPETVVNDGKTYSVTSIQNQAFQNNTLLTSIKIGDKVNTIGYRAFYGCTSLTEVVIPDNVTTLGVNNTVYNSGDHFRGCTGLTSVTIGAKVKSMGNNSFAECSSLTNVTIKDGCTIIGNNCFASCTALKAVTIPNSVESIEGGAFSGCKKLTSIDIPQSVNIIGDEAFKGCTDLEKAVIGDRVTSIGQSAFNGCTKLGEVKLGEGLNTIGYRAFYGCTSLTEVVIPDNVTTLGVNNTVYNSGDHFRGCTGLTSVTIGAKVKSMGNNSFAECSSLTNVTIKDGCTIIGNNCFASCTALKAVTIPNSVESIEGGAFSGCKKLTSIDIPQSVNIIGDEAFKGCTDLEKAVIGDRVTSIGQSAFNGCTKLGEVKLGEGLNTIGYRAFYGCTSLTEVVIPDNVTTLGVNNTVYNSGDHFRGCTSLTSVTIGAKVKSMGDNSFTDCSNLSRVIIKNGCQLIGNTCFGNCNKITEIYCYSTDVPSANSNSFGNYNATLYVTKESIEKYKGTSPWSGFAAIDTVPYVKYMVDGVFTGDEQLYVIGDTIVPIAKPEREGYTFYGWDDIPTTMPTDDVIAKGQFVINSYKLTYLLDDKQYKQYDVEYNSAITAETEPAKEGYTFSGWSTIPAVMPAKDVTVKGSFNINSYVIKYIINDVEYLKETLNYDATITPPRTDSEGNQVKWETYPQKMPANDYEVKGVVVKNYVWLTLKDGLSGSTKVLVPEGDSLMISVAAEEGWKVQSVTMDDNDVTEQLSDDNMFTTPALMNDAVIIIVYEQKETEGVASARISAANVKVVSDGVIISNAPSGTRCTIFTANGVQVIGTTIDGNQKITLRKGQTYVLKLDNRTLKFVL